MSRSLALLPAALLAALAGCASVPSPLAPNVKGSIGGPSFGLLTSSAELPARGQGFRRLRPASPTYFGTPALVATLQHAAAIVSPRPEDPPLLVGDIAGKRGGKLEGHHSHRTGRDVDLLFFYTTLGGEPLESPGFLKVQPDGLAFVRDRKPEQPHFVRFDVERSWALVKALLQSPDSEVLWIFCSVPVEALLTEHARARGEPDELVWRAVSVMQQPGDSTPHDDHFHLRIRCTPDEELAGCVSGGPDWPWLSRRASFPAELDAHLAELLTDPPEEGAATDTGRAGP